MKGNPKALAQNYILDKSVCLSMGQRFVEGPRAQSKVSKEIVFANLVWKTSTGLHTPSNRPDPPTSVFDTINALVAEWEQIPAARFQNLAESRHKRVETVVTAYQ